MSKAGGAILPLVRRSTVALLLFLCALGGVQAQTLSSLTVAPAGPTGGDFASGRVTLTAPAPAGGLTFNLSSSVPGAASVPATVTVAAGQTQGAFSVTTTPVAANTPLTLTVTDGTLTRTAAMTVYPPQPLYFGISANTLIGGAAVTGTLMLDGAAPAGGFAVRVLSSDPQAATAGDDASGSPALVVPAGTNSLTFPVRTSTVNFPTTVTLTVQGAGLASDLRLLPTNLHVVGLLPPNVVQLAWDAQQTTQYRLYRAVYPPSIASQWTLVATLDGSAFSYDDAYAFAPGTAYVYVLTGHVIRSSSRFEKIIWRR
jgi:hypothetical protein